jgi:hypothetical protein
VKVLVLPDNADPDEFIRKFGVTEYQRRRAKGTTTHTIRDRSALYATVIFTGPRRKLKPSKKCFPTFVPSKVVFRSASILIWRWMRSESIARTSTRQPGVASCGKQFATTEIFAAQKAVQALTPDEAKRPLQNSVCLGCFLQMQICDAKSCRCCEKKITKTWRPRRSSRLFELEVKARN